MSPLIIIDAFRDNFSIGKRASHIARELNSGHVNMQQTDLNQVVDGTPSNKVKPNNDSFVSIYGILL